MALMTTSHTDRWSRVCFVEGMLQRKVYEIGNWLRGKMSVGQACSFTNSIEPIEAIVDRIISDAVRARDWITGLGVAGPTDP